MVIQTRDYTVENFDDFVELSDNKDKLFEYSSQSETSPDVFGMDLK